MDKWKSREIYEHPLTEIYGNVVLSTAGVYAMRVGESTMACLPYWAAKIHKDEDEADEKKSIIIRNVPESIRRNLKAKAALEGKSMQGLILELITSYVK
jgi:hypothetical protein